MKRIFKLTKAEQRVVILIVALLVAIAFARHWFATKLPPPTTSESSPTASPTIAPLEKPSDSDE